MGMETSFKRDYKIVSYGGGVEVKNIVKRRDKRANLAWRWGAENFLTRNLVVSYEPRLAKKDVALRVERLVCFHFLCLLDHMSIMF